MADLHRRPHRLGDAPPRRIDQGTRRRARDEDPRQVEQQGRVLVAARIQARQRHQQFAAAHISVADQVEGGVGRDEAVVSERSQQMRAAVADHVVDLGHIRRARNRRRRRRFGVLQIDGVQQLGHRRPDRGPVRRGVVARGDQRLAQALQPPLVAQFLKPGPPQQRAQRRIAERGPVEFGEMRVAAPVLEHGIADVIQRRAVLAGRQRAVGGPGEMLKVHWSFFSRALASHVRPKPRQFRNRRRPRPPEKPASP